MWTCGNDQPVSVWLRLRLETVAAGRVLEAHVAQIYPILGQLTDTIDRPDDEEEDQSALDRSLTHTFTI